MNFTFFSKTLIILTTFFAFHQSALAQEQTATYSPTFPMEMEFASDKVSFDRFDMYERMDREIISLTYSHTNTMLTIKRANKYIEEIIPILKEEKIPTDFIYLAAIESQFNERAISPTKAAGIWQFMPTTAKQYGLEVNKYVDERFNLEKATRAACKYFRTAYRKYNDWLSVAASYNAGMTRISKSLEEQLEKKATDIFLNQETSRYIFRILAMKLILNNPEHFGFKLKESQLYQHIDYKEVEVKEPVLSWPKWAKKQGISYMHLREMNPWIRDTELPNKLKKTYSVRIPYSDQINVTTQTKHTYKYNWIQK